MPLSNKNCRAHFPTGHNRDIPIGIIDVGFKVKRKVWHDQNVKSLKGLSTACVNYDSWKYLCTLWSTP